MRLLRWIVILVVLHHFFRLTLVIHTRNERIHMELLGLLNLLLGGPNYLPGQGFLCSFIIALSGICWLKHVCISSLIILTFLFIRCFCAYFLIEVLCYQTFLMFVCL